LFPLLYCLLPNKTQRTYESVLRGIQQRAEMIGMEFKPKVFQLDYEQAMYWMLFKRFFLRHKLKGAISIIAKYYGEKYKI